MLSNIGDGDNAGTVGDCNNGEDKEHGEDGLEYFCGNQVLQT